jgi:hypothetical protein
MQYHRNRALIFAFVAGVILCLWAGVTSSATFHVSPFGSDTPPYDTYAKAAHKVADGVLAATGFGDTVLIHTGTHTTDTTIHIPRGLTLGGVGRDSAVLNWVDSDTAYWLPGQITSLAGDNEVYGLEFGYPRGSSANEGIAGISSYTPYVLNVHDCRFRQLRLGVSGSGSLDASENEFLFGQSHGIRPDIGYAHIHDNSFWGTTGGEGVICLTAGTVLIEHNVFNSDATHARPWGVYIQYANTVTVRNNLILRTIEPVRWSYASGTIENNTMIVAAGLADGLPPEKGIHVFLRPFETLTIRNNVMKDFEAFYKFGRACDTCDTTGLITFVHNSFWPPQDSFYQIWPDDPPSMIKVLDSANFNAYPMFTQDSLFQLQYGSPLIEAGDPAVKDADSSRSDIGWWGGPNGSTYGYQDLPPATPESLKYDYAYPHVSLWWHHNHEVDLQSYAIHRDAHSGFLPTTGNRIGTTLSGDTTLTDSLHDSLTGAYYKVVAVDATAHESPPSNEVAVIPTGILDPDDLQTGLPLTPRLLGNYPNPFNSSTVFTVYLPAVGASPAPVEVIVYDALGRAVTVGYRGALMPGRHQIRWDGTDSSGHPLASGVYFARLKVWGAIFDDSRKLVIVR